MSVTIKGIVKTTRAKPVMLVLNMLQRAIDKKIGTISTVRAENNAAGKTVSRLASVTLIPAMSMAQIDFCYKGTSRTLTVFFSTDCDHRELHPYTITVSMGSGGTSEEIIHTAIAAMAFMGAAYVEDESQGDDHQVCVHENALTFREIKELTGVTLNTFDVAQVADAMVQRALPFNTLGEALGLSAPLTEEEWDAMSYDQQKAVISYD